MRKIQSRNYIEKLASNYDNYIQKWIRNKSLSYSKKQMEYLIDLLSRFDRIKINHQNNPNPPINLDIGAYETFAEFEEAVNGTSDISNRATKKQERVERRNLNKLQVSQYYSSQLLTAISDFIKDAQGTEAKLDNIKYLRQLGNIKYLFHEFDRYCGRNKNEELIKLYEETAQKCLKELEELKAAKTYADIEPLIDVIIDIKGYIYRHNSEIYR